MLEHLPFYDVLRRYPPELTVPFLRQASWQDDQASGRLATVHERAARLFLTLPAVERRRAQDRLAAYLATRMVDPLVVHLYGGDGRFLAQYVTVEGQGVWEDAYRQYGRAVLVSPHWGPYLATPGLLRQLGIRLTIPIDAELVPMWEAFARHFGEDLTMTRYVGIPGQPATERLAANLAAGYTPFVTPDFNLGRPSGMMVPFLGRPLPATTGPARLALGANVPILPVVLTLVSPLRYHLAFGDPLFWPEREAPSVEVLTRRIFACLDEVVQRDPALWWGWMAYEPAPIS